MRWVASAATAGPGLRRHPLECGECEHTRRRRGSHPVLGPIRAATGTADHDVDTRPGDPGRDHQLGAQRVGQEIGDGLL